MGGGSLWGRSWGRWCLLPLLVASPVAAQTIGYGRTPPDYGKAGLFEGLFADHSRGNGDNGSVRIGGRMGDVSHRPAPPAASTTLAMLPAPFPHFHVYQPKSIAALAAARVAAGEPSLAATPKGTR